MSTGLHRRGVLCAGSIVQDTIVRPIEQLRWGTTTPVQEISRHVGGNGANTARALAMLGIPVRLAGVVGNDDAAEFALRELTQEGVDVRNVRRVDCPNAASIVLVNARGERQFLHQFGASESAFERPEEFAAITAAQEHRHFHLASLYVLPHLRRHAPTILRTAQAAGMSTSLDVNWDAHGEWLRVLEPCLRHTDVLFLNEDESRMITGLEDTMAAAAFLHCRGANLVVQKLGAEGCIICAREAAPEACAPFLVAAVDSTGAGDCFAAGFLSAFLEGRTLREAGERGNAAGAMSVSQVGAVAGLRRADEFVEWMRATPRRVHDSSSPRT